MLPSINVNNTKPSPPFSVSNDAEYAAAVAQKPRDWFAYHLAIDILVDQITQKNEALLTSDEIV